MNNKILVIVGPTASGKSDLAVRLAKKIGGEVISADSRQVYKGLDIGTGKITKQEMKGVQHYMLDVANPKQQYSVVRYIVQAEKAVVDIASRGKVPIICGGTGFYISALLGNENTSDVPPNHALRKKLQKKSAHELFTMLQKLNPKRASAMNESDRRNPRRLIRAIEIIRTQRNSPSTEVRPRFKTLTIGILPERKNLRDRIHVRLLKRIKQGMIKEAETLHKHGVPANNK